MDTPQQPAPSLTPEQQARVVEILKEAGENGVTITKDGITGSPEQLNALHDQLEAAGIHTETVNIAGRNALLAPGAQDAKMLTDSLDALAAGKSPAAPEANTISSYDTPGHNGGRYGGVQQDAHFTRVIDGVSLEQAQNLILGAMNDAHNATQNERGGSTASVGIVTQDNQLVVGQVGDSHVLVFVKNDKTGEVQAYELTQDHSPQADRARIESEGGSIAPNGRLNGVIAVARSYGDAAVGPGMTDKADPYHADLQPLMNDPNNHVYVVIASDGVSEAKTANGTVHVSADELKRIVAANTNPAELPEALAKAAMQSGSTDNITVTLVEVPASHTQSYVIGVMDGHGNGGEKVAGQVRTAFEQSLDNAGYIDKSQGVAGSGPQRSFGDTKPDFGAPAPADDQSPSTNWQKLRTDVSGTAERGVHEGKLVTYLEISQRKVPHDDLVALEESLKAKGLHPEIVTYSRGKGSFETLIVPDRERNDLTKALRDPATFSAPAETAAKNSPAPSSPQEDPLELRKAASRAAFTEDGNALTGSKEDLQRLQGLLKAQHINSEMGTDGALHFSSEDRNKVAGLKIAIINGEAPLSPKEVQSAAPEQAAYVPDGRTPPPGAAQAFQAPDAEYQGNYTAVPGSPAPPPPRQHTVGAAPTPQSGTPESIAGELAPHPATATHEVPRAPGELEHFRSTGGILNGVLATDEFIHALNSHEDWKKKALEMGLSGGTAVTSAAEIAAELRKIGVKDPNLLSDLDTLDKTNVALTVVGGTLELAIADGPLVKTQTALRLMASTAVGIAVSPVASPVGGFAAAALVNDFWKSNIDANHDASLIQKMSQNVTADTNGYSNLHDIENKLQQYLKEKGIAQDASGHTELTESNVGAMQKFLMQEEKALQDAIAKDKGSMYHQATLTSGQRDTVTREASEEMALAQIRAAEKELIAEYLKAHPEVAQQMQQAASNMNSQSLEYITTAHIQAPQPQQANAADGKAKTPSQSPPGH